MHTFSIFLLWLFLTLSLMFYTRTAFLPRAFIAALFIFPVYPYLQNFLRKWKGTRCRESGESSEDGEIRHKQECWKGARVGQACGARAQNRSDEALFLFSPVFTSMLCWISYAVKRFCYVAYFSVFNKCSLSSSRTVFRLTKTNSMMETLAHTQTMKNTK